MKRKYNGAVMYIIFKGGGRCQVAGRPWPD